MYSFSLPIFWTNVSDATTFNHCVCAKNTREIFNFLPATLEARNEWVSSVLGDTVSGCHMSPRTLQLQEHRSRAENSWREVILITVIYYRKKIQRKINKETRPRGPSGGKQRPASKSSFPVESSRVCQVVTVVKNEVCTFKNPYMVRRTGQWSY